jgi:hypothetical protein
MPAFCWNTVEWQVWPLLEPQDQSSPLSSTRSHHILTCRLIRLGLTQQIFPYGNSAVAGQSMPWSAVLVERKRKYVIQIMKGFEFMTLHISD